MGGNRSKSAFSTGNFEHKFKSEGGWCHCCCQNSRAIAVSCGVKISAVHHLVLSQCTRLTDRQTDRQTDGQTDRRTDLQNCDSNTVRCITCGRTVKTMHAPAMWSRARTHPVSHAVLEQSYAARQVLSASDIVNSARQTHNNQYHHNLAVCEACIWHVTFRLLQVYVLQYVPLRHQ